MDDIAILVENVSKSYKLYNSPRDRLKEALNPFGKIYHKDFYATKNISLEIRKGEILGIVGKNGCGKSTLLKLISNVLTPTEGKITVNGTISALLELGSGFNPEFTGIQNIYFYGMILGFSKNEIDEILDDVLAFADIGEFIHQPLKTYSSGMKSRLGFSLAVSVNPDILIVDEVLAVGDLLFQRKCYNKIHKLFNDGKTVLFVSHNPQAITQHCTRAILLKDGRMIINDKPKNVIARYEKEIFTLSVKTSSGKSEKKIAKSSNKETDIKELRSKPKQTNTDLAKIYDIRVIDSNNKLVNLLERGIDYSIEFKVRYHSACSNVALGARIKNMKGFVISGANLFDYQQQYIEHVEVNDEIKVNWKFRCILVPDVYSVTVFSFSTSAKEMIELSDALLFKVMPDKNANYGVVGLDQVIKVEMINSSKPLSIRSKQN